MSYRLKKITKVPSIVREFYFNPWCSINFIREDVAVDVACELQHYGRGIEPNEQGLWLLAVYTWVKEMTCQIRQSLCDHKEMVINGYGGRETGYCDCCGYSFHHTYY